MSKKVSVTLTTSFQSLLWGRHDSLRRHEDNAIENFLARQIMACRKSLTPVEVSLPAAILTEAGVGPWVRKHRLAVDVRTRYELHLAMSSGVHPSLLTVHADQLDTADVHRVAALGVGRVVLGAWSQIDGFDTADGEKPQNVVLRMCEPTIGPREAGAFGCGFVFDSHDADSAVERVLSHRRLNLTGLHCDVGHDDVAFFSYPAAVGYTIAEMDHIRRGHGRLLTCLGIGGARFFGTDDEQALCELAGQIDEAVDDACATLRFPRPVVMVTGGRDAIGRAAA